MPLVYQQNINDTAKIGVWHITENEAFFLQTVSLQRNVTHPNKRLQHLAARYLLSILYPNFPMEEIEIAESGKPFLQNKQCHFSISHCHDYAAVIVSDEHNVGIDIEPINDKASRVQHKFLSDDERLLLEKHQYGLEDINRLFTTAWCIKETLYKWQHLQGVDFAKHLQIHDIHPDKHTHIHRAECVNTKNNHSKVEVSFMQLHDVVLAWCVQ